MNKSALIGAVGTLITIIGFIAGGITIINSWIDSLRPPTTLNFYFLVFWALVAATLGGLVWNVLNSINDHYHIFGKNEPSPYVGPSPEPHGIAAIIWPITTNVPIILTLVILNWKYRFSSIPYQLLLYCAFLIGVTIGSLIFYDFPLQGKKGFRNYFDSTKRPSLSKEFWLVVLWSFLLSSLGFLAMGLMKLIVAGISDFLALIPQIGFCVALTMLAVVFFLLAFSDVRKFESARGIIAGLALRMTLFFGLLLGTSPVNVHF
jgi:hypothetical protein